MQQDDSAALEDWKALGAAVQSARIQAGYRYRRHFAAALDIDDSTLADLEKARRKNFSDATLDTVSRAVGWAGWGWRDVLAGRKPTPAPGPEASNVRRQSTLRPSSEHVVGSLFAVISLVRAVQRGVRRGEDEEVTAQLLEVTSDMILQLIGQIYENQGDVAPETVDQIVRTATLGGEEIEDRITQLTTATKLRLAIRDRRRTEGRGSTQADGVFEPIAADSTSEPAEEELWAAHQRYLEDEERREADERQRMDDVQDEEDRQAEEERLLVEADEEYERQRMDEGV